MTKVYQLKNLDCANCAAKMEKAIMKLPAVNTASVNFISQKLVIDVADSQLALVLPQIIKVCHKIEPDCEIIL